MRTVMIKHKVSGVPYEVELDGYEQFKTSDYTTTDEMIAELERENFMLRARIDRLEEELKRSYDKDDLK
jgi:hypothetical protein